MIGDLKLLSMASALARHSAARHEILAENIANADTGGYRARDLESFGVAFSRESRGVNATGDGAVNLENVRWRAFEVNEVGLESPNGNTVSLEDQMMRTIETQQNHQAATAIYKKAIDILRLSLGRGM